MRKEIVHQKVEADKWNEKIIFIVFFGGRGEIDLVFIFKSIYIEKPSMIKMKQAV